jgi:hypothetical protein
MSPKEVFAVAAIAFCLEHNEEFKKAFLCNFCEINLAGDNPKIHISADDHKWCDLMIKSDDSSFVCVLEFKIDSPVASKQNPNSNAFEYGMQIGSDPECQSRREKLYLVVTKDENVKPIEQKMVNGLQRDWKSWTDFWNATRHCDQERGLSADLFDCLGDFDITVFRERQLRNMKLENSAFQAKMVIQVLQAVYRKLEHEQLKINDIVDHDPDQESWQTGVNVWNKERTTLKSWFGYLGKKQSPQSGHCEIWFYDHLKEIRQQLQKRGIEFGDEKDGESNVVRVKCPLKSQTGNLEWFESVYKAVGAIEL